MRHKWKCEYAIEQWLTLNWHFASSAEAEMLQEDTWQRALPKLHKHNKTDSITFALHHAEGKLFSLDFPWHDLQVVATG